MAFQRYAFGSAGGYVTLDFLKNGLSYPGSDGENTELVCENVTGKTARGKFISQGVEHYRRPTVLMPLPQTRAKRGKGSFPRYALTASAIE